MSYYQQQYHYAGGPQHAYQGGHGGQGGAGQGGNGQGGTGGQAPGPDPNYRCLNPTCGIHVCQQQGLSLQAAIGATQSWSGRSGGVICYDCAWIVQSHFKQQQQS
ncbi:hypothetical protein B9479_004755 [Cryptococcus floricola]|uniref:Uncharacterized protein n=1 Tax=Cryptococcus floricola TaxID=2591691 RepID=A0A5D3AT83_9TREE|nr:hypothetical protein B9479_004755 [Cryptococcus floricola]